MRPSLAIAAAAGLIAALTLPASGRADGMSPAPGCHCPHPVKYHLRAVRFGMRYARAHHAWRSGRRWPLLAFAPRYPSYFYPTYFGWVIPSPDHPGYDRAMVLLGRSPAVSGIYTDDPGMPTAPLVVGIGSYQYAAGGGAMFQYDMMTGEYVQLSREDAARLSPAIPPMPLSR